jgi:uncharacterized membrane protein YgcG
MAAKKQSNINKKTTTKKKQKPSLLKSFFSSSAYTAGAFVVVFAGIGIYLLADGNAATAATTIKGVGGKCLDNRHNDKVAYNKIQLWVCNGTGAQEWTINASSSTPGTVVNSNGYCLDVYHDKTASRTPVDLYPCNGTTAQEWVVNDSTGTFINPHSGLCLDDKWGGTANGNQIWAYTCNGTSAQHWTVTTTGTNTSGGGSATGSGSGTGSGAGSGSGTSGTGSGAGGSSGSGSATSAEHIVSTLYAYPTFSSWLQIENAAPTVKYAIVNICAPDGSGSGCGRPADEANSDWIPTIQALEKKGITPLYYISTNYGAVSITTVENELANAKKWYGITDPMFDTTSTTNPMYYNNLYDYAVTHGAGAVMYNPGTQVPRSYMFGVKQIMQVFEGTAADFRGTSFPSWMKSYPSSEFSATLSAGNSANVGTDVNDAAHDNIGNFYEDNEAEPPNYSTLPSYWQTEVSDVANVK